MKNAGKACNNRLYRHIRTFEKIIKNYFVIFLNTPENAVIKDQVKLFNISPDAGNVKLTATLYDKETGEQILDADD